MVTTKHQRVDAIVKKKGERPYGTPCGTHYGSTCHTLDVDARSPHLFLDIGFKMWQSQALSLLHKCGEFLPSLPRQTVGHE